MTYGEFLQWIGIRVLMSTVDGADCWSFWLTKTVDAFEGAPFRLTPFISRRHFEKFSTTLDTQRKKHRSLMIVSGKYDR